MSVPSFPLPYNISYNPSQNISSLKNKENILRRHQASPQKDCAKKYIEEASQTQSPKTLASLSHHQNHNIRLAVAKNGNTDGHTLDRLAHDKNIAIRAYCAQHKNAHPQMLDRLLNDSHKHYVVSAAARNPNISVGSLIKTAFINDKDRLSAHIQTVTSKLNDFVYPIKDAPTPAQKQYIHKTIKHIIEAKEYLKNQDNFVLFCALKNPSMPQKIKDKYKGSRLLIEDIPTDHDFLSVEGKLLHQKTMQFGQDLPEPLMSHTDQLFEAY